MTKLIFTYNDGRGRSEIILDNLLPCTAADFKRLLSFVNLSNRPDDHAAVIFDYISGKVADLQKEREKYDPESMGGKKQLARIAATIKKHIANASQLSKIYDFPEIEDDAAKIVYRSATVYRIVSNGSGKTVAESFSGWTFKKAGYEFDIYRSPDRKAYYNILLHGTGLAVAGVTNRSHAAEEITPRVLKAIKEAESKMTEMRDNFRRCMIEAGFMENDERAENISSREAETENTTGTEEAGTMTKYEFSKDKITIDGITYPAEYTIAKNGTVNVFAILSVEDDGRKHKKAIRISQDYDEYAPAYNAAIASQAPDYRENGARGDGAGNRSEIISEPVPAAKAADKSEAPQPEILYTDENGAARDPKTARGPVPEKTFIGSSIEGHGWKILFDGSTSRTRVIFEGKPTNAARAAIEEAGFYYSPNMKSWNKKLTFRAYRAAQNLSHTLNELYAA